MKHEPAASTSICRPEWILAACAAALLSACGGAGNDGAANSPKAVAEVASGTTILQMEVASLPDAAAALVAQPLFHAAPALLPEPDDADTLGNDASARRPPHQQPLSAHLAGLPTRGLTPQDIESHQRAWAAGATGSTGEGSATPMGSGSVIATYTPAQIRAAYGLPALPAAGTTPTAAQAAQQGAGQTVYIIGAQHNPNAAAELAAFNQKFGLPACTTKAIAPTAALPLAKASASACEFSVVYSTASGTMTSTVPAYNSGWATEMALDVQWAHATAPLARIVLIEAADPSVNSLLGAVKLANAMGPGVVSMSFGAAEGTWTASVDPAFTGAQMTYLAATGDSGAAVSWPSVSSNVVAVGGTTLTYTGSGSRSEVSWSGTGGGTSQYTPTPSYQTAAVPGMGTPLRRTVADVAFNADPASGQYVAVLAPGSSTVSWISAGGTSLSTPQWAGLIAVANAQRASAGKLALGAPQSMLYGQIAGVPGTYASAFLDITLGSYGSCGAPCTAKPGYDPLSGLGTPNVSGLLSALAGTNTAATAPVVTSATIAGTVGTPLTFTVSALSANPLSYSLSGAPAGMSIGSNGVVSWATPVAGSYAVTVTALDTRSGLSGQGLYTVKIAQPPAPVVSTGSISGSVGKPLSFSATVTASNPVTYSLSGAPAGMSISSTGTVSWAAPVVGSYTVTVVAKDTKTGLTGQGVLTIKIATAGPVITAAPMTGVAGKPMSGAITITAPGATWLSISISGVPLGMSLSASGTSIALYWATPVTGNDTLQVSVVDQAGLSAKASIPITVTAK